MYVEMVDVGAIRVNGSSKSPARDQSFEGNCRVSREQHLIDTGSDSPSRCGVAARRAEKEMRGMQLSEVSDELFVRGVDLLESSDGGGLRKSQSSFYFLFFSLIVVTD